MTIIIYPAIDLRAGQVVRLRQGDPAGQTVFAGDPAGVARRWADQGAQWLHVVNLDGAFGQAATPGAELPVNLRRLAEIRAAVPLAIQYGGGLRAIDDVARALDLGATRVVLGTVAVRDPHMVEVAIKRFGAERIVIGIDARGGRVAVDGWQETAAMTAGALAQQMRALGIARAVYTDISRDGMLTGANVAATAALARASGLRIIASGGVAGLADIHALAAHEADGIEGVILGQALYTGVVDLAAALRAAVQPGAGADRGQP